jgi:TPR repeat protein
MRILLLTFILFSLPAWSMQIAENKSLMEDSYVKGIDLLPLEEIPNFSATAKNPDDYFRMGQTYLANDKKSDAIKAFKIGIELGSKESMVALGRIYRDEGRGTESLPLFSKAAKAGLPEGIYELGVHYEKGIGVIADFDKALKNYTDAANAGIYNALIKLGIYSESLSKLDLAVQYFEKAYTLVKGTSQRELLSSIIARDYIVLAQQELNDINKLQHYLKAANYGSKEAQYEAARAYEAGKGTIKDTEKAKVIYEGLAGKDFAPAMVRLGALYYDGLNMKRDYNVSKGWFEKAAERGDANAARYLGDMYEYGRGVKYDPEIAKEWKNRAGALGAKPQN